MSHDPQPSDRTNRVPEPRPTFAAPPHTAGASFPASSAGTQHPATTALPSVDEPATPGIEEVTERPHPLTPVAKSWVSLVVVGGILVNNLDNLRDINLDSASRFWWIAPLAIIGVLLLGLGLGYLDWRFTRFVVNDEQLRIERNFISKRSERVALTKIQSIDVQQPLIPRLLGLAAVHVDVGASGQSPKIEYLSRRRAYQMRDYLMHRASGMPMSVAESAAEPVSGVFTDRSASDTRVVTVPPQRLVLSIVVSWPTVIILVLLTTVGTAAAITDSWGIIGASMAALVPTVLGIVQYVWSRLRNEWNFTLLLTSSGSLRTSAGLTSLVSQTVPRERVQAIEITHPLLWRAFGWYRVKLDMVGLHAADNGLAEGLLLPIGTREEADRVIAALWPGFHVDDVPRNPSPAAARRIRWFDGHRLWWGHTDDVLVAHHGWLTPRTSIVPHARVQSVRLRQGVLQRRLGLASVEAHTTPGPVTVVARHLAGGQARELAMGELDRMRRARLHGASWLTGVRGDHTDSQYD